MTGKMSIVELVDKIEWEGGVYEALQYGIRSEHIASEEIAAIWRGLETYFDASEELIQKLRDRIPNGEF